MSQAIQDRPPKATPGSGAMFDQIASRYDLLNRLMSMGVDRSWRRKTVDALALGSNARVLDLATGTADLALLIAEIHPDATIVGVDPSVGMLQVGEEKARREGYSERVSLREGDAQALVDEDDSFDATCIAFGIRNVPDRKAALREMARVTRPGGRVAILELTEPRAGWLSPVARFHVHKVVPRLGALLSGSKEYRYLEESIAAFPAPAEFAEIMQSAGLTIIEVKPLTFGSCTLFVAEPEGGR